MTLRPFLRHLALPAVASVISSCGPAIPPSEKAAIELRGSDLASAELLLKRAPRTASDEAAAVYQLRAAEIAWEELDTDGGSIQNIHSLSEPERRALRASPRISSATGTSSTSGSATPASPIR
jgi:outer membrane PBP1 activator LpoA protein